MTTTTIEVVSSEPSTTTDHEGAMDFTLRIGGHEAEATLLPCECCDGRIHGFVTWGSSTDTWLDSRGMRALSEIAGQDRERYRDLCGEIEAACNAAR